MPATSNQTFATGTTSTTKGEHCANPISASGNERFSPRSNHLQITDEQQQTNAVRQHIYLPRKPPENGNLRVNLRRVDIRAGPSPCYILSKPLDAMADKNELTNKNHSVNARQFSDVLGQKPLPNARTYYPQQNFSFRRAVRRSLSSGSEQENSDIKRQQAESAKLPQGVEKSSRKSDDRDSGAVVEPEASVFDFESFAATEDEIRPTSQSTPSHSVTLLSSRLNDLDDVSSRTSTPILPPLSSDGEYTDVVNTEVPERAAPVKQSYFSNHRIQPNTYEKKGDPKFNFFKVSADIR